MNKNLPKQFLSRAGQVLRSNAFLLSFYYIRTLEVCLYIKYVRSQLLAFIHITRHMCTHLKPISDRGQCYQPCFEVSLISL